MKEGKVYLRLVVFKLNMIFQILFSSMNYYCKIRRHVQAMCALHVGPTG